MKFNNFLLNNKIKYNILKKFQRQLTFDHNNEIWGKLLKSHHWFLNYKYL